VSPSRLLAVGLSGLKGQRLLGLLSLRNIMLR
jgi:hypothetical protein